MPDYTREALFEITDGHVLRRSGDEVKFGTVGTTGLADGSVTYATIQDVAAESKLLGRGQGSGAGDVQEITLGTNLSMSGTTLNASGGGSLSDADYGDITVSGGGTVMTIDNSVVTDAKLRDSAALSVIGRASNTAGAVADITPGLPGVSAGILEYNLLTSSLRWAFMNAGVVGHDGNGISTPYTIQTTDIASNAVSFDKLAAPSGGSLLLGTSNPLSGPFQEITLGTNLSMSSTTLNASGGGGSGNSVTSTLAFGASFTDKAQTVVTGQAWVSATSEIVAQVKTPAGVDPDEMRLLDFRAVISDLVAATGFTITLFSESEAKGDYEVMCVGV
ncbi:MAG TPA: hypothetical protein PLO50_00875 [Nitrospira sp.]|nr:hypothetical protein [Nitrospira sp.]